MSGAGATAGARVVGAVAGAAGAAAPAMPAAIYRTAPLSPGQERLLAAEFTLTASGVAEARRVGGLRPGDTQAALIEGPLDVTALSDAVRGLVARQSSLRTSFRFPRDGQAIQIIAPDVAAPLVVEAIARAGAGASGDAGIGMAGGNSAGRDLAGAGVGGDAGIDVAGLVSTHGWPRVDPTEAGLFGAKLLVLGPQRSLLLVNTHHLCSDGWSIGIINMELSELYEAHLQRRRSTLKALDAEYCDLCVRMRQARTSPGQEAQLAYWRSELRAVHGARSMTYLEHAAPAAEVALTGIDVPGTVLDRLKQASPGRLAAPVLAAIAVLAFAHSGQTTINIGCMASNRTWPDSEPLVGNFVNIVVIRLTLRPEDALADLVRQASQKLAHAMAHQQAPIQDVAAAVTSAGGDPHYDITLSLLPPRATIRLRGVTCTDVSAPAPGDAAATRRAHTSVVWRWFLEEAADGIRGTLTYDTGRFSPAAIARTAVGFQAVLDAAPQRDVEIATIAARLGL